jgi:hypothetical protein
MAEILVALFLAFLVTWGVMAAGGDRAGSDIWPVFVLFFVLIWAGGLWLRPVGPPVIGIYWLPFVLLAVMLALFWAAVPPPPRRRIRTIDAETRDTAMTVAGFGLLFWLLLVVASIAALVRYAEYV